MQGFFNAEYAEEAQRTRNNQEAKFPLRSQRDPLRTLR